MSTHLYESKSITTYEIKGYDPKSRRFEGIATKEIVDRDDEIVRVKAFADGGLDAFMKNPVLLLNHDSFGGPVGKVLDISIKGDEMPFQGELRSPDDSDRMRDVVSAVEGGFLKAFSIGFGVPQGGVVHGGVDSNGKRARRSIVKAELREISLVAVGANSEALMKMLKTITVSGLEATEHVKTIWGVPTDVEVLRKAQAICERLQGDERKGLKLPEDLAAAERELSLYLWNRGEERAQLKQAEDMLRDMLAGAQRMSA